MVGNPAGSFQTFGDGGSEFNTQRFTDSLNLFHDSNAERLQVLAFHHGPSFDMVKTAIGLNETLPHILIQTSLRMSPPIGAEGPPFQAEPQFRKDGATVRSGSPSAKTRFPIFLTTPGASTILLEVITHPITR